MPFTGAIDFHDETNPITFATAEVGSGSSIDAVGGTIHHNNWNHSTGPLGVSGLGVFDGIIKNFTVAETGNYRVTFHGSMDGEFWNVSDSAIIGGSKGGGILDIRWHVNDAEYVRTLHDDTENILGTFIVDLVKAEVLGYLGIGDAVSAVEALGSLMAPQDSWNEQFIIELELPLESGVTYSWGVNAVSSLATDALGIATQISIFDLDIDLDQVSIVYLDTSGPIIDSFFDTGNPYPVVKYGQLLLSASASDSDGYVTLVEFYRDANGNGVLDIGVDEFVGSDTSPSGGEWTWLGTADWDEGTHKFFARARDNEGNWSSSASTFVNIDSSSPIEGNDFEIIGENWDDGTSGGDDDGVMEAGESVRLKVRLQSNGGAQDVDAILSTSDPLINITDCDVYYDHFSPSQLQLPVGYFDMDLNFDLDEGQIRTSEFTLHVTYELDGIDYYQDLSFSETFYEEKDWTDFIFVPNGVAGSGSNVIIDDDPSYSYRNNGDGIFQSGEEVRVRPQIQNNGITNATRIDVSLPELGSTFLEFNPNDEDRYPDLGPGGMGTAINNGYFEVRAPLNFSGGVDFDIQIVCDEATTPYHVFTETSNYGWANNMILYDYASKSSTYLTNYSRNGYDPMGHVSEGADFNESMLVWQETTIYWETQYINDYWTGTNQRTIKFNVDTDINPIQALDSGLSWPAPASSSNRFAYIRTYEDPQGNDGEQIFLWDNGTVRRLTEPGQNEVDHGNDILCLGGDFVVYDKRGGSELYYWDLAANQSQYPEYLLSNQMVNPEDARMDGKGVVWIATNPQDSQRYIYYAYIQQPDIAIASSNLNYNNDCPVEGDPIDISVVVRNLADYNMVDDITIRLYDGNPDTGGVQLGSDQIITGGLIGQEQTTVNFTSITTPENIGSGDPETHDIYVRIEVAGFDNPDNNTVHKMLDVYDDDTYGPTIYGVSIIEANGDGDGIIGADEQLQIQWNVNDPAGVGAVNLWIDVDGDGLGLSGARDIDDLVSLDGEYYAILGALGSGAYDYVIGASDADNSPEGSEEFGSFVVVESEEVTIRYNDQIIVDGETAPIAFGQVALDGLPSSKTLAIHNDGEQQLVLGEIIVPEGFAVSGPAVQILSPGEFTHIVISLQTGAIGTFAGDVSIVNSDSSESPDGLDEGQFTFTVSGIVYDVLGDFSQDGELDAGDIDFLFANHGGSDLIYDLTDDYVVDDADVAYWLHNLKGTEYGDANLDGRVSLLDLDILGRNWGEPGGWAKGDFSGNGVVTLADLDILGRYWRYGTMTLSTTTSEQLLETFEPATQASSSAIWWVLEEQRNTTDISYDSFNDLLNMDDPEEQVVTLF